MRDHILSVLSVLLLPLVLPACAANEAWDAQNSETEPDASTVGELTEALSSQPVDTLTFFAVADTSVRASAVNKNFGKATSLDINRGLVMFDATALKNATLAGDTAVTAKLRLTLVPTAFPRLQRNLEAHRLLKSWTELGATWNCAVDSNPANSTADCTGATKWSQNSPVDAFAATATGTAVIPSSRTGVVEIDVSADVRNFKTNPSIANYGWLLKTGIGNGGEVADVASRESSTPPQLVLTVRRCSLSICDDHITCSQDGFCDSMGFCQHLTADPVSPCDDGNPCTLSDHCSGVDFSCAPGAPATDGSPCSVGTCDGAGHCVPAP
jgi:hypothetical protein